MKKTRLDFLAFGPHPDDCEIGTGAFLLKMKKMGYKTGMVVLTEGDMGRGTPQERKQETLNAAKILRVDAVEMLNMGDCRLEDNHQNRIHVAGVIRKYKPTIILAPYYGIEPGRGRGHADHITCGHLVTHAANFAHLAKFPAKNEPHAVSKIMYYYITTQEKPTIVVPVDEELLEAEKAILQHKSQFGKRVKKTQFPSTLQIFGRYYGIQVGCLYAQPFYMPGVLRMDDPYSFFITPKNRKKKKKKK